MAHDPPRIEHRVGVLTTRTIEKKNYTSKLRLMFIHPAQN